MIKFPEYFDTPKVINAFKTLTTEELYVFFDCSSRQAFANLMKKYFPGKPFGIQYREYVRSLLADELDAEDPRVQQAETVKTTAKSLMFMKPKEEEKVPEPEHVPQPRIRTELDIWTSKQLFKEAGRTTQNLWLKAGHPDPLKETEDAPYDEEHVFTNLS